MLGKSLRKIGNVNSMNGTMTNTENGTNRNRSAAVLVNFANQMLNMHIMLNMKKENENNFEKILCPIADDDTISLEK